MKTVRHIGVVLFWICQTGLICAATIHPAEPLRPVRTYGRGMLLDAGGQRVLLVAGTPYEMGYQQGKLLAEECRDLIQKVLFFTRAAEAAGQKEFLKLGSLEEALARSGKFIDRRFYEEMKGLSEGAGIPMHDVELANIFPELFHCSGFAVFGKATHNGTLFHGRILDYMTEAGLQDFAVITIAKPDDGHAFVTVGYAGFVGSVTAMNQKQIALGEMGGKGEGAWDGMPMSFLMRKVAEEADTLEEALKIFQNTPRTCEYFYVVSDGKSSDARGLACWPDKMLIFEPGKSYERLSEAIEDAVLMSADERYQHLARLVRADYGKIDVDEALDLMNRPVAMKSCLHRVLFSPRDGMFWVANAAAVSDGEFQACYQPWYRFDFNRLLGMIPDQSKTPAEMIVEPNELKTMLFPTAPSRRSEQKKDDRTGVVDETIVRKMAAGSSEDQRKLLAGYKDDNSGFSYRMTEQGATDLYTIYEVSFPSSFISTVDENNTIYCEYYKSKTQGRRPAVILLDIMVGSKIISRILANGLANEGISACIMTLPYYDKRKPADVDERVFMDQGINFFTDAVRQAVVDVRRTARWLAAQDTVDSDKIGICGTSLGGFVAALSAGIDGRFKRASFILAGGDLTEVLSTEAREVRRIKEGLAQSGIQKQQLREILSGIEPLNFSDRLRGAAILMINAADDTIVPAGCAKKLAESTAARVEWYPTDHYGMVKYLIPVLNQVCDHFKAQSW
ncbi:MAG TPA: C45 family autoproteolytic acyltransferase/hydrolase [Anaerohalosphaeraceae bacterium]|nr:C45 family autoproteolytic acyltransferase/hydrolase [Anaerohalosphaeraceae bacterium]